MSNLPAPPFLLPGLRALVGRLLPQECFVCGALSVAAGGGLVCAECQAMLPRLPLRRCPVCALPGPAAQGPCAQCRRRPPAFDATHAVFAYRFPVDRLVQGLKYHRRLALARFLGECLVTALPHAAFDCVLPMPLHPSRLRERGFNQAVEVARTLAAVRGLALELEAVRRVRDVPAQAGLPRKARQANVRGAFACGRSMAGLRVLVVDDVMTTGSSLDEVARSLKAQGATTVVNLVVARTY